MALKEYVGAIVLEVDSKEIEIVGFSDTTTTGRRPVKTMNKERRVKGFCRGITEYSLQVTAVVPIDDDIDWEGIEGAKLVRYADTPGGKRTSYMDCCSEEVGEEYSVDGEARRNIKMFALRKVTE